MSGLPPRLHNLVSYLGAAATFTLVVTLRAEGATSATLLATGLWLFHFTRRSLESAFVHRYGGRCVSFSDAAQEYVYYWGFATWIAWVVSAPTFALPPAPGLLAGVGVYLVGEAGILRAHWMLRALREREGSAERRIPRGFLFEWVSCPHYLFEIVSWLGFAMVTRVLASAVFLLVGAGILTAWAIQRHRAYHQAFDGADGRPSYPSRRRALVPFLL